MTGDSFLVWSIKASFVEYVERMSDGAVTASGGASRRPDGAFQFPLDPASSQGSDLAFRGSVRFTGHFGMLMVSFTDPVILRSDGELHLTVADDEVADDRLDVLALGAGERTADGLVFSNPQLTRNGAELFFDNYRPGAAFDPVLVVGSGLSPQAGES